MKTKDKKYLTVGISERIKREREIRSLSQEAVVGRTDDELSIATLSRYENNSVIMNIDNLAKIAQALDVPVADLLCEADNLVASREAAKFIYYYPLIPRSEILDTIRRIGGLYYRYEGYIWDLLHRLVENIPDSRAKKWADFNVRFKSVALPYQSIWDPEEADLLLHSCKEVMELFGEDTPDDCYDAYCNVLKNME